MRFIPPTIRERGLENVLGTDRYKLFVTCMELKVSTAETARKLGCSRQQAHRYKEVYLEGLQSDSD